MALLTERRLPLLLSELKSKLGVAGPDKPKFTKGILRDAQDSLTDARAEGGVGH